MSRGVGFNRFPVSFPVLVWGPSIDFLMPEDSLAAPVAAASVAAAASNFSGVR